MAILPSHANPIAKPGASSTPAAAPARTERSEQIFKVAEVHLAFGLITPTLGPFGVGPIGIARALSTALVDFTAVVTRPLFRIGQ